MARIFVTSDTHGCNVPLKRALAEAGFNYTTDTLIHIGDVTDRGPDSYGVVETLLAIPNLVAIRGNHCDWMRDWFNKGIHPNPVYFGKTRDSYRANKAFGMDCDIRRVDRHREFFENQVDYYIDDQNRCFVHGGYDRHTPIAANPLYMLWWDCDLFKQCLTCSDNRKFKDVNNFKRVFIGHQPTTLWKKKGKVIDKPIYKHNIVNVDTGIVFGDGKLSLLDITDDDAHILYQTTL